MNKITIVGMLFLINLLAEAGAQTEWKRIGPTSLNQLVYSVGTHPKNPDIILIGCRPSPHSEKEMEIQGADGIDLSTDGGITWSQVGKKVPNSTEAGPNENSARFNPYFPDEAWMGIEKHGTFHSTDGGKTWQHLASGMKGDGLNGICFGFDPRTPKTVYYGSDGGVFKSIDDGQHWTLLQNGIPHKGPGATVSTIVVDPSHPDTVYAAFAFTNDQPVGVYKSTDAGAHWTFSSKGMTTQVISGDRIGVTDLVLDPQDPMTLYAVLEVDLLNNPHDKGGIYRSTNGGADWMALAVPAIPPTAIAIHPKNPKLLYVGCTNGSIFCSEDGGTTWKDCSKGLVVGKKAYPWTFTYEGSDGTKHEETSYCYESGVRTLAFGCKAPFLLYAGTNDGLFVLKP